MGRIPLALLLALPLAALAPTAAAEPVWTKSGTFHVGSPLGDQLIDACAAPNAVTEGVDSNCVRLPAGLHGLPYDFSVDDETNQARLNLCFYAGSRLIACNTGIIPFGADRFATSSLAGVQVRWSINVF